MAMVADSRFLTEMEFRLRWYQQRDAELALEGAERGGISRHDHWRRCYYNFPYMIGSDYAAVRQRFIDAFLNINDINEDGQITHRMDVHNEFLLTQKFTHVLEELGVRGGMPLDAQTELREPLYAYFANGAPVGLEAMKKYLRPSTPILVKYSQKKFLLDMYRRGIIRICPASNYSAEMHNSAVRDAELERPFVIPTFRERLRGETQVTFQGHIMKYGTSDFILPVVFPDFYVYCLSESIFYRLPTDFHADAALIIRDSRRFVFQLRQAFRQQMPGYRPVSGEVVYYDPYTDHTKIKVPQMSKHLRYSYQREYRVAFLPERPTLRPNKEIFVEIGSMEDYADLLDLC